MKNLLTSKHFIFAFLLLDSFLVGQGYKANAQADLTIGGTRLNFIPISITNFGANPNDNLDDTWAFIKASKWLANLWDKQGIPYTSTSCAIGDKINYSLNYVILSFPASTNGGAYLVGKEFDVKNNSTYGYQYHSSITPVTIPYSEIFGTIVPVANTEGIDVGIILKYNTQLTVQAGQSVSNFINANNFDVNYSTVPWISTPIFGVLQNGTSPIDGIWLQGELNTKIRKNANMHLGFWDEMTHEYPGAALASPITDWWYVDNQNNIQLGGYENINYSSSYWPLQQNGGNSIFGFDGVKNLKITDMEIDGNKQSVAMGGLHPTESIQSGALGIDISNTQNISIENMNIHHNSFDGIRVTDKNDTKFDCKHTQLNYNGRTNFAWISGKHFNFENVDFNYAGKVDELNNSGYGNPNCGIDMEPDDNTEYCQIGTFTNCNFIGNSGVAISCDSHSDLVDNQVFNHCTMWDGDSFGLICKGKNITYNTSNIYCSVFCFGVHGTSTATKFNGCYFEDKNNPLYPSLSWLPYNYQYGTESPCRYLIQTPDWSSPDFQSTGTEFNTCHFKLNGDSREMFRIFTKDVGTTPSSEYTAFDNCDFTFNNSNSLLNFQDETKASLLNRILFIGKNHFVNNNIGGSNNLHKIVLRGMIMPGSIVACEPDELSFSGNIHVQFDDHDSKNYCLGENATEDGYADMKIENNAIMTMIQNQTPILNCNSILKNSKLIIEGNGAYFNMIGNGQSSLPILNVEGKLIVKKDGYFYGGEAKYILNSNWPQYSLLYLDHQANLGIPPMWQTPLLASSGYTTTFDFNPTITNHVPCVQGGNTNLPSGVVPCVPSYSNILTQGTLSILYSTTNNICNGASAGAISYLANGNAGAMSYTLNGGVPTTATSFTGLTAGLYTLVATDASCTSNNVSISFQITQPLTYVSFTSATSANITCNNANDGSINVLASGGTGAISYNLQPTNTTNTTGSFIGLSADVYTVTARDANNCSITTTLAIINPTIVSFAIANYYNVDCAGNLGSISTSATGGTGTILYSILPAIGNQPSTNNFTGLTPNTYTITATDINGCTAISTVIINAPTAQHCSCTNGASIISTTQNLILVNNISASSLISLYNSNNSIFTNKTVYIDGTFTIDHNITFDNTCHLYFTPIGNVVLNPTFTFDVLDNSILQGACDDWVGITAAYASNKISITNSTIRDMNSGIKLSNNAELNAEGSTFENNIIRSILYKNINNSNYAGYIKACTFKQGTSSNLIPEHGIEIVNSDYIIIGGNSVSDGNTFKDLYNGINITGTANIATVLGSSTNSINLFNNVFENINLASASTNYAVMVQEAYTNNKGSAIYIDYGLSTNFDAYTEVSNTTLSTTNTSILNCSRGIISMNNHLKAERLWMKNTPFGVMNNTLYSRTCYVRDNIIEDALIGTQLAGNYYDYDVNHNTITITAGITLSNAGLGLMAFTYPAIGIDIKQMNQPYSITQKHKVQANTVNIPYNAGKGIASLGTNKAHIIAGNTINFTTPNGTPMPTVAYCDPGLYGIFTSNSNELQVLGNYVNGQYSNATYQNTFSRAYYFETTHDMAVMCNKAKATKQGLYAWGNNSTADINIAHNKFRFNLNPLFTLDNGNAQAGTFGNIGDGSTDNENDWLYNMSGNSTWLQNGLFKVWRFSNVQINDNIKTHSSLLNALLNESGSTGGVTNPFKYIVQNPTNIPTPTDDECPDLNFGNTNPPQVVLSTNTTDDSYAEDIATQEEAYIDYAEVGAFMNQKWLFDKLSANPQLMTNSTVLANFFTNYENGIIGNISNTELAMATLFDFKGSDSGMIALYNEAILRNSEIAGTEIYETNEATVNLIALHLARFGKDSLSETELLELEVLSNTCPFVGGSAVYKARVLYSLFNPLAQFNDRFLCIQGANKGGSSFVNIDSLYESQTNEFANQLVQQQGISIAILHKEISIKTNSFEDIILYPNPANRILNIEYNNKQGELIIYDLLGKVILKSVLDKEKAIAKIDLPTLANGLYNYHIIQNDNVYSGKINIMQHE